MRRYLTVEGEKCLDQYQGPHSYKPLGVLVGSKTCMSCHNFRGLGKDEDKVYVDCDAETEIRGTGV